MKHYLIEKDVPFDVKYLIGSVPSARFPFKELEVGDSFTVPARQLQALIPYKTAATRLGKSFYVLVMDDLIRIWRMS